MPVVQVGAVAVAYFAAAKLGIELDVAEGVVTPVWAPTGLALAALLLLGYRVWPGVAVGAFAANATSGVGAAVAAGIAAGNTLEGLSAAYVLRRLAGFRPSLDTARDVLALVVVGGLLATTIAATVGSGTLLLGDEIQSSSFRSTWFLWWWGDVIGAVIVAPLFLTWASRRRRPMHRFDVRAAATANFVVTAIAVWATVRGWVLLEDATPTGSLQVLQGLLTVFAVAMLLAAATIDERSRSLSLVQATLDSTADGVLVVDLDGRVVSFNQRFADMWRIPREVIDSGDDETLQRYVLDQLSDPSAFLARVRQVYSHPSEESSDVLLFNDGRVFERNSLPQRLGDQVIGRVWSFKDVTDARRSEVLRGRFLDMAGHEMRNPLQVVSSFAGVLLTDWDTLDDTTKRDYVERIRNQADKLRYVVDAFLLTSRLDAGKLEPRLTHIDVASEARELAADHAATVDAPERTIALADPAYLRNMVVNYLSNAEKYGEPPVTVTVDAADGFARVCVSDAGSGIPPELVPDLFERFSPTREALNPRSPGSGLGLWIVRELARAQGGEAWYEPSPDGARFCFRLPLAD